MPATHGRLCVVRVYRPLHSRDIVRLRTGCLADDNEPTSKYYRTGAIPQHRQLQRGGPTTHARGRAPLAIGSRWLAGAVSGPVRPQSGQT